MSAALGWHATAKTSATGAVCGPTPTQTSTGGAGSIFWLAVGWVNGNATAPTISDSKANTWTQVGTVLTMGGNVHTALFRCEAGTGGTLHTATATFVTAPDAISMFVDEGVGCVASSITDQAPAGNDDAASPYTSAVTGTTAQANELIFSWIFTLSASGTEALTHGNSFTQIDAQTNANTDITGASSQRSVTSIGTFNSSVTSTGAGTTEAISYIVTMKDATPGGTVQVWVQKNGVIAEAPLFEEPVLRRRIPITLFRAPDFPPLVQYDTSDLDPAVYDDVRQRRPWAPVGSAVAQQQARPDRASVAFDEPAFEERLSKRAWYPGSTDRPIFTPRRAPEERAPDDLQTRRPWYPGSTDAAPNEQRLSVFDEGAAQDLQTRRPWPPVGTAQAGNQPPRAQERTYADESYPDGIQRRPWLPVSGPAPDNAPGRRAFAVSDELLPDGVQRRPWLPVSGPIVQVPRRAYVVADDALPDGIQRRPWLPTGPIPDQPPRQRARVLADDALPDERQRRPWLPVSGPVLQQQVLARPRGVLDEAIEERLQRRPWLPVSSDAPARRAGRMPSDELAQDERLQRRQWVPVGTALDAPPSISRVRVADDRAPDELRRKPWLPEGAPVIRDNPPSRVVRVFADDAYPDELRRRPWLPVSGPVIPHIGGEARLYYRTQSARVRIGE